MMKTPEVLNALDPQVPLCSLSMVRTSHMAPNCKEAWEIQRIVDIGEP